MTTRDDLRMTASEIAAFEAVLPEIEEREAKATDGPWYLYESETKHGHYQNGGLWRDAECEFDRPLWDGHDGTMPSDEDIDFMAHARLDVPALLRYARTLKAQLVTRRLEASLHDLYSFLNAGADAGVDESVSAVVLRDAAWKAVARDLHEQTRAGALLPPELPTSISYAGIVLLRASDVRAMVETPP